MRTLGSLLDLVAGGDAGIVKTAERDRSAERPPRRDRSGPVVPSTMPVSATSLARVVDGADVPAANVLSAKHLDRIAGGLLYAATSNVPWSTLLACTFDVDAKSCVRCGGRLQVRAVVTDHDSARKILAVVQRLARPPPPVDSVASQAALA